MRRRPGGGDSAGGACGAGWAERMLTQADPAAGQTGRTNQSGLTAFSTNHLANRITMVSNTHVSLLIALFH